VLTLLTIGFAVLALTMAPNSADLAVHNGTAETFSAHQFSLQLADTTSSARGAAQSSVRLVDYAAPDHMGVYRAGPRSQLLGSLNPRAITTALEQYLAITAGPTNWIRHGSNFHRTESLQDYAAVQNEKTAASGTVAETAIVRGGYLIAVVLTLRVKSQTDEAGQTVAGGTARETLHLLRINGVRTPAVGPLTG
jgi:hypothetical protein